MYDNHDHLILAVFGIPTAIAYLVHCQRQHVRRKTLARRRTQCR